MRWESAQQAPRSEQEPGKMFKEYHLMGMVKYLFLLECLECMRNEKIVHIELNYEFFAQIGYCNLLAMRSQSDGVGVCLKI